MGGRICTEPTELGNIWKQLETMKGFALMESPLSPEEDIPGASFGESEQDLNLNKSDTKDRISNDNEEDNRNDIRKGPPVTSNDMDDSGSGNTE